MRTQTKTCSIKCTKHTETRIKTCREYSPCQKYWIPVKTKITGYWSQRKRYWLLVTTKILVTGHNEKDTGYWSQRKKILVTGQNKKILDTGQNKKILDTGHNKRYWILVTL